MPTWYTRRGWEHTAWSSLVVTMHPDQGSLGLGEPQVHRHVTVQGDGGAQGGVRLLALARRGIQQAQAPVAVGHERAHAQFLGQGEGLLVVGFGLRDIRRVGVGMDDSKLVQCVHLVGTFFVPPSQGERLARVLPGLLAASCKTTDLTEPCNPVGMV